MGRMERVVAAITAGRRLQREENAVEILVERVERVPLEGGFGEEVTVAGPFRVRVHRARARLLRGGGGRVADETGRGEVDGEWGLVGGPEVDVRAGPDVVDGFELWGKRWRVTGVAVVAMGGAVFGVSADVEVVREG